MTTNDKKDYYKPGASTLIASIAIDLPHNRPKEYFEYLSKQLSHSFSQILEDEFSKMFAGRLESFIGDRRIDIGKVILTIPEKALQEILSVCDIKVRDNNYGETFDIDTKVY